MRTLVAALLTVGLVSSAWAAQSDARAAVEAFVNRVAGVSVSDLLLEQTLTLYHPDGLHPQSTGEQRVFFKLPRRQRVEQVVDGEREVRLAVGDRVWIRQRDGRTFEAPPGDERRDRTHLLVPFRRTAADVLAEWRSLGVRDDVTQAIRVGGRPVTVIGAGAGDRSSPAVWLDAEHGVVRVITRERLPSGEALVDLALSDHRPLPGGFFFPYRQEAFVEGKLIVRILVRSVAVNSDLPDSLFDPDALRAGR
jgi:outer membrane lipoprotein-sorting protein